MKRKTVAKKRSVRKISSPRRTHNAYVLGVDVSSHPAVFAGVCVLLITGVTIILIGLTV